MKIILGSKSFGRKKVLEDAGYTFIVMDPNIDEKSIRSDDYRKLPMLLAHAKADTLLKQIHEPAILITSDQIVVCKNEIREKPISKQQAQEFLRSYGNNFAETFTAVVVTNTATGKYTEGLEVVKIFFKPIPENVINQVIDEGRVMHTTGAFMSEDPLLMPYIKHIEGSADSVIGLPLKLTERLMKQVM